MASVWKDDLLAELKSIVAFLWTGFSFLEEYLWKSGEQKTGLGEEE